MPWAKICTTWGVLDWKEVLALAEKASKDMARARNEKRKKFLQKLSSELRKAVWMDKYVAQAVLNDAWGIFCRAYSCKNCPISQRCKEAFAAVEG